MSSIPIRKIDNLIIIFNLQLKLVNQKLLTNLFINNQKIIIYTGNPAMAKIQSTINLQISIFPMNYLKFILSFPIRQLLE